MRGQLRADFRQSMASNKPLPMCIDKVRETAINNLGSNFRYGILILSDNERVIQFDSLISAVLKTSNQIKISNGHLLVDSRCIRQRISFSDYLADQEIIRNFIVRETEDRLHVIRKLPELLTNELFFVRHSKILGLRSIKFNSRIRTDIISDFFKLTSTESKISKLLCEGLTQSEIAAQLCITRNTVKTHMKNLYSKTCTKSQAQLISKFMQMLD